MNSVTAQDKARNYSSAYSEEHEREVEDQENLEFYEERERVVRAKTKRARERVRELNSREVELESAIERVKHLRRTKREFWRDEDFAWWDKVRGKISFSFGGAFLSFCLKITAQVE